ncbi:MAG: hypothetical protein J7K83_02725 [Candidatus Aenigmarchaeota archaeon]|nr:hypothetical protein [Candidatus Aenigmarchaeota archaeon]
MKPKYKLVLAFATISKKLSKLKKRRYLLLFGLFIAMIVVFLLLELISSEVNLCLINGTLVKNASCEERAIEWFPLFKK